MFRKSTLCILTQPTKADSTLLVEWIYVEIMVYIPFFATCRISDKITLQFLIVFTFRWKLQRFQNILWFETGVSFHTETS